MSLNIEFKTIERLKGLVPEPVPAYKAYPDWFQELPKKDSKCPFAFLNNNPYQLQFYNGNVTGCIGIQDFFKLGYIIPNWAHFVFREDNGSLVPNWLESPYSMNYKTHNMEEQFPTMKNPPTYKHFSKVLSPWIIQTSPGVSCLITHPVWHRNKNFTTATGVFHTDQSPLTLPWFFEWNVKIKNGLSVNEGFEVENQCIEREEPLMLVIPFYRKKFNSHVEYVSENEYDRLNKVQAAKTHKIISDDPYRKFRKSIQRLFS
jgi:hypothetical protein|tara:strand:+ start:28 stop:807 length:780 start_codon:yes stop_codon:yes gene_type:complete